MLDVIQRDKRVTLIKQTCYSSSHVPLNPTSLKLERFQPRPCHRIISILWKKGRGKKRKETIKPLLLPAACLYFGASRLKPFWRLTPVNFYMLWEKQLNRRPLCSVPVSLAISPTEERPLPTRSPFTQPRWLAAPLGQPLLKPNSSLLPFHLSDEGNHGLSTDLSSKSYIERAPGLAVTANCTMTRRSHSVCVHHDRVEL